LFFLKVTNIIFSRGTLVSKLSSYGKLNAFAYNDMVILCWRKHISLFIHINKKTHEKTKCQYRKKNKKDNKFI